MNKVKLILALVALTFGMFLGSAYSADKQKPLKSHDPAASEVTGRSTHPDASGGSEVKSHDPAASEVTGRSTHPDASGGSDVKAHKEGQEHDRAGAKNSTNKPAKSANSTNKPAKSAKQKAVKSHDPAASEVTGRSTHPDASGGSEVKSHDPAASEVTGRSTHPDASEGSAMKSHKEGQEHDRGGVKTN